MPDIHTLWPESRHLFSTWLVNNLACENSACENLVCEELACENLACEKAARTNFRPPYLSTNTLTLEFLRSDYLTTLVVQRDEESDIPFLSRVKKLAASANASVV
jgi:hypothetical protein